MSVNIFGSRGRNGSSSTNTKYVDQKFAMLITNLAANTKYADKKFIQLYMYRVRKKMSTLN